jgi:hypothetical protein
MLVPVMTIDPQAARRPPPIIQTAAGQFRRGFQPVPGFRPSATPGSLGFAGGTLRIARNTATAEVSPGAKGRFWGAFAAESEKTREFPQFFPQLWKTSWGDPIGPWRTAGRGM